MSSVSVDVHYVVLVVNYARLGDEGDYPGTFPIKQCNSSVSGRITGVKL